MKIKLLFLLASLLISHTAQGQLLTRNILVSGNNRIYDLELPSGWAPGARLPLVMDLHYLGGDARDEDTLTRFSPIADTANFIICHPWGSGTNWNAGFNSPYTVGSRDVEFIQVVIDSIDAEFGVDLSRVYVAGMGQGGFMAHRLACELGGEIAAIAAVGASIADSTAFYCNPGRAVPVMMVNGTADQVIDYSNGNPGFWRSVPDLVWFWLGQHGCSSPVLIDTLGFADLVNEGSTVSRTRHYCTSNSEVLLYKVYNGGFAWPGAQDSLPNSGIINQDINAAEEIWKFFSKWTLNGPVGIGEESQVRQVKLWPNPVTSECTVALPTVKRNGVLRVVSAMGREHVKKDLRKGMEKVEMEMGGLETGIYFVILELEGERYIMRLKKE